MYNLSCHVYKNPSTLEATNESLNPLAGVRIAEFFGILLSSDFVFFLRLDCGLSLLAREVVVAILLLVGVAILKDDVVGDVLAALLFFIFLPFLPLLPAIPAIVLLLLPVAEAFFSGVVF